MSLQSQLVLRRAEAIKTVKNPATAMILAKKLVELPPAEQEKHYVRDVRGGFVFLYGHSEHPNLVVEIVQAMDLADNVISLYESNDLLNSRGGMMQLRLALIDAIEQEKSFPKGGLKIHDPMRLRDVMPGEMTTDALIDVLRHEVGVSLAVVGMGQT